MKDARILFSLTVLALFLAACQKQGIFYWGDYSETYYDEMKNPCEATSAAHLKSLETIIEQSRAKNLAVPPGIHAEYGYIMLKAGKADIAIASFEQEKALYPESRVFMNRLIASAATHKDYNSLENDRVSNGTQHSAAPEGTPMHTGTDSSAATN
jgi:hypothetical protein